MIASPRAFPLARRAARGPLSLVAAAAQPPSGQKSSGSRGDATKQQQPKRGGGRRQQRRPGGGGGSTGGGDWLDVESAPAWRVMNVSVPADADPGKDDYSVHLALLAALAKKLGARGAAELPPEAVRLVRKSFDARSEVRGAQAT